MVAIALPYCPSIVAPAAFESVTANFSVRSKAVSAATLTVIVLLVSPDAKASVPLVAPTKSAASAAGLPVGLACQDTEVATAVSPVRTTLKVNGVDPPLLPSSLLADCNPISSAAGGGQVVG